MERFLIVKTSALGDIIHAFPVVQYLRSRFPNAQIDWVAEEQGIDLVRAHPEINQAICVKTKKWRKAPLKRSTWQEIREFRKALKRVHYDYVFDLQGNVKSGWVTAQARAKHKVGFAWKTVPEWPNLLCTSKRYNPPKGCNIREDYLYVVREALGDKGNRTSVSGAVDLKTTPEQQSAINFILSQPILQNRKKVLVCPGSAWPNKQMSEQTLGSLLKKLEGKWACAFLLIWGNQEEYQFVQKLQKDVIHSTIVDRLSLPALQQLMASVDLVISVDSLPLHLAGTTKTPTFSVFGPSSLNKYQPQGQQHSGVQGNCPYGRTFEKRCPVLRTCPTGSCIRGLDFNVLFDEIT